MKPDQAGDKYDQLTQSLISLSERAIRRWKKVSGENCIDLVTEHFIQDFVFDRLGRERKILLEANAKSIISTFNDEDPAREAAIKAILPGNKKVDLVILSGIPSALRGAPEMYVEFKMWGRGDQLISADWERVKGLAQASGAQHSGAIVHLFTRDDDYQRREALERVDRNKNESIIQGKCRFKLKETDLPSFIKLHGWRQQ